jgi:hypothetical protein
MGKKLVVILSLIVIGLTLTGCSEPENQSQAIPSEFSAVLHAHSGEVFSVNTSGPLAAPHDLLGLEFGDFEHLKSSEGRALSDEELNALLTILEAWGQSEKTTLALCAHDPTVVTRLYTPGEVIDVSISASCSHLMLKNVTTGKSEQIGADALYDELLEWAESIDPISMKPTQP